MRKLVVYSGITYKGGQKNTVVATRTKKRACELLGISASEFNNYWSEASNPIQVDPALAQPETVLRASDHMSEDYKEET
jgi:hypothetical protein